MKKVAILGIDIQNDFTTPAGALYVNGAEKDVLRIADFIRKNSHSISYIALSLDSHQPVHIAHQCYWKNMKGEHPAFFSNIMPEDVASRNWIPQYNAGEAQEYLTKLEARGEACTVWPVHCVLGSEGWALDCQLLTALTAWTIDTGWSYELFYKGYAQNTEHYSIFRAAVEWERQPETQLNRHLLDKLDGYDELIIVGEAADYCVCSSLNDIVDEYLELAKKTVLFTDCMSWIASENVKAKSVFEKAEKMGVRFMKSSHYSFG